ncbi:MAG TPA: DegT/DnrJ/EryC1/StrS family aminotransferase [Stellaceae bacterium]|nr:DegT/DnrJ/EryC1/StrS family aminotransferase [Stellaceae bacterium]
MIRAMREVPYVNLAAQFEAERSSLMAVIEGVLAEGAFVGGSEIARLETALAAYCEMPYAVGVASGTDALILGMKALGIGPGDEVITPPNSFVASTASIVMTGATPVFADVLPDQNIDPEAVAAAVTSRTKAIMAVHLTGRVASMDRLAQIAENHGLFLIEDAAQAMGARYMGRPAGSLGDLACFSAHPLKNLNATGDAGFIVTGDGEIATRIGRLRNHGLVDRDTAKEWSSASRLDTLQAAILLMRLAKLDDVISQRRANAEIYCQLLDPTHVYIPPSRNIEFNSFHTFVIQVDARDKLKDFLAIKGIRTAIHYPIPIHLQPAAEGLGYKTGQFPVTERQADRILTLPIHQFLSTDDIEYVAETVNCFYGASPC